MIFYYRYFDNFSGMLKYYWSAFGLYIMKTSKFLAKPNKTNRLNLKYYSQSLAYCLKNKNSIKIQYAYGCRKFRKLGLKAGFSCPRLQKRHLTGEKPLCKGFQICDGVGPLGCPNPSGGVPHPPRRPIARGHLTYHLVIVTL